MTEIRMVGRGEWAGGRAGEGEGEGKGERARSSYSERKDPYEGVKL